MDEHGREISRGYSREKPHQHAEESALSKLPPADQRLTHATLYSSLEPCTSRKSHKRTCTELIITARIPRVVIAWREPPIFVTNPHGIDALQTAGVTVTQYHDLAETAAAANTHILTSEAE